MQTRLEKRVNLNEKRWESLKTGGKVAGLTLAMGPVAMVGVAGTTAALGLTVLETTAVAVETGIFVSTLAGQFVNLTRTVRELLFSNDEYEYYYDADYY